MSPCNLSDMSFKKRSSLLLLGWARCCSGDSFKQTRADEGRPRICRLFGRRDLTDSWDFSCHITSSLKYDECSFTPIKGQFLPFKSERQSAPSSNSY